MLDMWENNPNFLKKEILEWVKKENLKGVSAKWPP